MFKRYWIVAVAFGLTLSISESWGQAATENQPRQEERASSANNDSESQNSQPVDLAPALENIEAAIRDLITEEDKIAAKDQQDRDNRDLSAQEGMAKWAEWMFYATVATVVLTLAALFAIVRTLHHTRRAADSADAMVKDTRSIGQAQVRAYLRCNSAKFEISKGYIEIFFDLENAGQSPAINVSVKGSVMLSLVEGTGESFEATYVAQSNVVEANFEPIASGASKVDRIIIPKDSDFDSGGMGQALLTNLNEANEILVAAAVIWDDVFDVRHRIDFKMLGFLGPNPTTKIKTRKSKGALRMRITKDWLTDKGCDED